MAFYDRYSWLAFGYRKYGAQSIRIDGNEYWVTNDESATDLERTDFEVKPLAELLTEKPMAPAE